MSDAGAVGFNEFCAAAEASERPTIVDGELRNVTVKRSEWFRGRGSYNDVEGHYVHSALRVVAKGKVFKHCCLGFAAMQCGVAPELLHNLSMVSNIPKQHRPDALDPFLTHGPYGSQDSDFAKQAASFNDTIGDTDEGREEKLTKLFAEHGIALHFVD